MKKIVNIAIILLLCLSCFGQTDVDKYWHDFIQREIQKIGLDKPSDNDSLLIRIWQSNYQVLELRRTKSNEVTGKLVNYVTKYGNRGKPIKVLSEVIDLEVSIAHVLLNSLSASEIRTIKNSSEIENYPDGFDGKTTLIEIYSSKDHRITSYWEIENDRYIDPDNEDIKRIRSILNIVNGKVSWWPLFKRFRDELRPGAYRYGGINMIVTR